VSEEQPYLLRHAELQVRTNLEQLPDLLTWFEKLSLPLPSQALWECQLILTEGFTNAVRHAHQALPETTPVQVEVLLLRQGVKQALELRVWDCGQPFDLEAMLVKIGDITHDPLSQESGRGLVFMKQLSDWVRYVRQGDRNCLRIYKTLKAP
jgi:serine/threonine-protein kinase RsbW